MDHFKIGSKTRARSFRNITVYSSYDSDILGESKRGVIISHVFIQHAIPVVKSNVFRQENQAVSFCKQRLLFHRQLKSKCLYGLYKIAGRNIWVGIMNSLKKVILKVEMSRDTSKRRETRKRYRAFPIKCFIGLANLGAS